MRLLWLTALLLSACGYHLVGHGDGPGAIPADVQRLALVARGEEGRQLLPGLRRELAADDLHISIGGRRADAADAFLIVRMQPVRFTPSAYDAAGIASQYRMLYSGSLMLERQGRTIWKSGSISEQGEVYVTGAPASIEASRQQLLRGLRKQWLRTAVGRLRSGF